VFDKVLSDLAEQRLFIVCSGMCLSVAGDVSANFGANVEITPTQLGDLFTQPGVVLRETRRRHQQEEIVAFYLCSIYTHIIDANRLTDCISCNSKNVR